MTFDLEVVVRLSGHVVHETLYHDGRPAALWTEEDVTAILGAMLLAVDRAASGGANGSRHVRFRGLSWIVSPFDDGVALAIEIPSGSVIAGPFDIPQARLDELVRQAVARDAAPSS